GALAHERHRQGEDHEGDLDREAFEEEANRQLGEPDCHRQHPRQDAERPHRLGGRGDDRRHEREQGDDLDFRGESMDRAVAVVVERVSVDAAHALRARLRPTATTPKPMAKAITVPTMPDTMVPTVSDSTPATW